MARRSDAEVRELLLAQHDKAAPAAGRAPTPMVAERSGVPREFFLLLMTLARTCFVLLYLRLVWRLRTPIAAMIRGDGRSGLRRTLAELWPVLMTAHVLMLPVALAVEGLAGRSIHEAVPGG